MAFEMFTLLWLSMTTDSKKCTTWVSRQTEGQPDGEISKHSKMAMAKSKCREHEWSL